MTDREIVEQEVLDKEMRIIIKNDLRKTMVEHNPCLTDGQIEQKLSELIDGQNP